MAAMQTTMISASITAYSTAVGPSSRFRKLTIFFNTTFSRMNETLVGTNGHDAAIFRAMSENTLLARVPRVVIAAMQTTMISASITAYSTAVGPSSWRRNLTDLERIVRNISASQVCGNSRRVRSRCCGVACATKAHREGDEQSAINLGLRWLPQDERVRGGGELSRAWRSNYSRHNSRLRARPCQIRYSKFLFFQENPDSRELRHNRKKWTFAGHYVSRPRRTRATSCKASIHVNEFVEIHDGQTEVRERGTDLGGDSGFRTWRNVYWQSRA